MLPSGEPAWLDGGPLRHNDPIDGVPVLHSIAVEHGRFDVPDTNHSSADLAPDQLAAVTHTGGAARIIAPAGSGKTRVLTERARHLLSVWNLPPSAVALVAFNKRAQEEMAQMHAECEQEWQRCADVENILLRRELEGAETNLAAAGIELEMVELLYKRLQKNACDVKLKTLRAMHFIARRGSVAFRRAMQRGSQVIRQHLSTRPNRCHALRKVRSFAAAGRLLCTCARRLPHAC